MWALLGYAVAVLVAAFVCTLVEALTCDFRGLDVQPGLAYYAGGFVFASFLIVITAWPGFIVTLAVAVWQGYRSVVYFLVCGLATTILAPFVLAAFTADSGAFDVLVNDPGYLFGGAAGGLAYGLFARRFGIFAPKMPSIEAAEPVSGHTSS